MTSYPPAESTAAFAANIAAVRARIDAAAARVGRAPSDVRLLPVSKTVPQERLRLAVAAGCRELGENKVQEAKRKHSEMADLDVAWAVIGHLQTNKAKDVAAFAAEFQALDSVRVADALDRRLQMLGRSLDVYVQVNTSEEESKYGLATADVPGFLAELPAFSALRVRGFMTLAEFSTDEARVRACFRRLHELRDAAADPGLGELSMGMSGDYEIAVEEGATCVRVGQAVFGSRALPDSHYWPTGTETTPPR
ncbi:YggS family pyridoxal phosphate-dependent enzyme [Tsukamurella sp. 1534]|uniref:YggS family pyridoxal phosphate-dependent enzyme n=1 Tax=Tsukamurella sp. 1534 TaxID=1151061 RepID=UPI0002D5C46D|nr:YggS family pyridoxal phosphate-dependent enzyme [Tsukamurella sp. 1534]